MAAVDYRYARALHSVVAEHKLSQASIAAELESFFTTMQSNGELRDVLENPSVPEAQKLRLLDALSGKLSLHKVVRNFVALLARHKRLGEFAGIQEAYKALADESGHVVEVQIVSARPIGEDEKPHLESQIAKLANGQTIHATYADDGSLLGGAIIRIGSTVYDGSVRAQLEQLKQSLIASVS